MIQRIDAEGILGKYNYQIVFDESRIKAIYAPNGSGKTNFLKILNLISLSTVQSFAELTTMPFRNIEIVLTDEKKINISKEDEISANLKVAIDDQTPIVFTGGELEKFRGQSFMPDEQEDLVKTISDIRQTVGAFNFISTNRIYSEDVVNPEKNGISGSGKILRARTRARIARGEIQSQGLIAELLYKLSDKFTSDVWNDTVRSKGKDGVYAVMTRQVLGASDRYKRKNAKQARAALDEQIEEINGKSSLVKKYRIIEFDEYNEILKSIAGDASRADAAEFRQLLYILGPYFDSLSEKIDSAQKSAEKIDTFIKSINNLFENKYMRFSAEEGLKLYSGQPSIIEKIIDDLDENRIFSNWSKELKQREIFFDDLSSGEKHLIMILANVTLSSAEDTLVLIDEPEISLGIEWQQNIVTTIEQCIRNSSLQVIFASHSPLVLADMTDSDIIEPSVIEDEDSGKDDFISAAYF